MALDATPGGPTANSYVSVQAATAYIAERLQVEPWYATPVVSEGYNGLAHRREAALMWATRLLDEQMTWGGTPATTTQALAWPQQGQTDRYGRPIDLAIVPPDIQRATAYYALALLGESSPTSQSSTSSGAIRRKKIGDLEIEYQSQTAQAPTLLPSQGVPDEIQALLAPYGEVPDPTVKYADIRVF